MTEKIEQIHEACGHTWGWHDQSAPDFRHAHMHGCQHAGQPSDVCGVCPCTVLSTVIELTTAHEFQVHGERGWFRFRAFVIRDGQADYHIDAYGGTEGRRRYRAFRPDAVRKVRLIADRGAVELRVALGCVLVACSVPCIMWEHRSLWWFVTAVAFIVAGVASFGPDHACR